MGLPSIIEKRDRIMLQSATTAAAGELPGYMQLTQAATRRRKQFRCDPRHKRSIHVTHVRSMSHTLRVSCDKRLEMFLS